MADLQFDAETHTYTLGGVKLPSVTTVLFDVGLYDFDFISAETLRIAAERGTIVHTYCEWYEQGILDESSIDPELYGYFESYLRMKEAGLLPEKPSAIERRLFSAKYKYAGTLDQMYEDDWINDIKSGLPGAEHGLQLSAYWLADHENMLDKPRRLTCSYLHRDGSCGDLVEYRYDPLVWLAVLTDYRWRRKNGKIKEKRNECRKYFTRNKM